MLPPAGDIVDIVENSTELSTLYSLVGQAGIASALKGIKQHLFLSFHESCMMEYSSLPCKANAYTIYSYTYWL